LSKGFETGINWKNVGFTAVGSTGTYTFKTGINIHSIEATIKALASEGKVTVLSSPRVLTMNNQQALIEVGSSQYFVTKVSSGTTPVNATTATLTSDVDLTPFFSGISLSVLPQINQTGDITLFIHPSVTTVTEDKRQVTLSASQVLDLPLAKSELRETDSVVRVKSGQIIVLGGLMQNRAHTNKSGIPVLSQLGGNTENKNTGTVTELVILLKATVPNAKTWVKELNNYSHHYGGILHTYKVAQ
jgi:MSHA biogenesis protein MshL